MRKLVLIAILVVVSSTAAEGGIVIDGKDNLNNIFFQNRDVVLRAAPGSSYGGLAGYRRVDISGGELVAVGDLNVAIFRGQNNEVLGSNIWETSPTDRFSGYGVFEIASTGIPPGGVHVGTSLQHITFKAPTVDPFGLLDTTKSEVLRLYEDMGVGATDWLPNAGTLAASVASVSDGVLFLSLDIGLYLYQHNDIAVNVIGDGFSALDVVLNPKGYKFTGVNDVSESEIGGGSPLDPRSGILTDVVASNEFEPNGAFGLGLSLWEFSSNDPFQFHAVIPEPSSFVIWAIVGFAGFLGWRRRRVRG